MEKVSYLLYTELKKSVAVDLIAWSGSQKWIPYFLCKAFIQSLFYIFTRKIDRVHIGDGLLAPLGVAIKWITRKNISVTVHGLDVTYGNPLYQAVVPRCLGMLDNIICISDATRDECVSRGILQSKCLVIPWGVYPQEFQIKANRQDLERIGKISVQGKRVLLTVGRLVERKGVNWFVNNVMPRLDHDTVLLVVGEGEQRSAIEESVKRHGFEDRVKLLGKITDHEKAVLYNTADIFVMPNIQVKSDMEGFGIVAVEASSTGLPVVAADLEGIKDAIVPGKTGILYNRSDAIKCIDALEYDFPDREIIAKETKTAYSWSNVINKYLKVFNEQK